MRTLSLSLFSILCTVSMECHLASAQTPAAQTATQAPAGQVSAAQDATQQAPSDVFEKAPPAIDDALRARVSGFYQAHVDGKFRQADQYVDEDSKDVFFAAEKTQYGGFQISKITYSDDFTKATVVTACKTELILHAHRMPVTMPAVTRWKIDNGQWFWYYVKPTEVESPWGVMKPGPPMSDTGSQVARVTADPAAAARNILTKVIIDRTSVSLDQTKDSKQEIHLKNGSLGVITVAIENTGTPGLTIKPSKLQVQPGEQISVAIEFNPNDPQVVCRECLIHPGVRPAVTATLTISPLHQRVPVQIVFTQPTPAK